MATPQPSDTPLHVYAPYIQPSSWTQDEINRDVTIQVNFDPFFLGYNEDPDNVLTALRMKHGIDVKGAITYRNEISGSILYVQVRNVSCLPNDFTSSYHAPFVLGHRGHHQLMIDPLYLGNPRVRVTIEHIPRDLSLQVLKSQLTEVLTTEQGQEPLATSIKLKREPYHRQDQVTMIAPVKETQIPHFVTLTYQAQTAKGVDPARQSLIQLVIKGRKAPCLSCGSTEHRFKHRSCPKRGVRPEQPGWRDRLGKQSKNKKTIPKKKQAGLDDAEDRCSDSEGEEDLPPARQSHQGGNAGPPRTPQQSIPDQSGSPWASRSKKRALRPSKSLPSGTPPPRRPRTGGWGLSRGGSDGLSRNLFHTVGRGRGVALTTRNSFAVLANLEQEQNSTQPEEEDSEMDHQFLNLQEQSQEGGHLAGAPGWLRGGVGDMRLEFSQSSLACGQTAFAEPDGRDREDDPFDGFFSQKGATTSSEEWPNLTKTPCKTKHPIFNPKVPTPPPLDTTSGKTHPPKPTNTTPPSNPDPPSGSPSPSHEPPPYPTPPPQASHQPLTPSQQQLSPTPTPDKEKDTPPLPGKQELPPAPNLPEAQVIEVSSEENSAATDTTPPGSTHTQGSEISVTGNPPTPKNQSLPEVDLSIGSTLQGNKNGNLSESDTEGSID